MPEAFWFVSSVVVALVAASEWARRQAIRGMRSPPIGSRDELAERRRRSRARPADRRRDAHAAAPPLRGGGEAIAIPQWQRDPPPGAGPPGHGRERAG